MNHRKVLGAAASGLLLAGTAWADDVPDVERIIDVERLRQSIEEATRPIGERLTQTRLTERFERVNELLEEEEVDKSRLMDALRELQQEMDAFTANWESGVAEPLWDGQSAVAETADRVRLLLARGQAAEPREQTAELLDNYDLRLESLANAIKAERDELRRQRLKSMFENVLALRRLVEQSDRIDLEPATEQVHARIVHALASLENQLTATVFQMERVRIILASQSEFVGQYTEILAGLIEAEGVARMLAEMGNAGTGVGALALDVDQLTAQIEQFSSMADGLAGKLAESIEVETERIADRLALYREEPIDIWEEIERYATRGPDR